MYNKLLKYKEIFTFVFLSFFLINILFYGLGGEIPNPSDPHSSWKMMLFMYTPAMAAYLTTKIYGESYFSSLEIFGKINKWMLVALLTPVILMILSAFISVLFVPGISFNASFTGAVEINDQLPISVQYETIQSMKMEPLFSLFISIFQSLGMAWSFGTLSALGEELGWRGYLLKKVEHLGFWQSAFIIGPIWGLWHAPILLAGYNYPSSPVWGVPMMMLACTALTPIMIYIRNKANSIWAAAVFHGSFNCLGFLSFAMIHGQSSTFFTGLLSFSGIGAAIVFMCCIVLFKKITFAKIFQ
jgi:membrane protease YdiL (CAAX protease family)